MGVVLRRIVIILYGHAAEFSGDVLIIFKLTETIFYRRRFSAVPALDICGYNARISIPGSVLVVSDWSIQIHR